MIRDLINRLLRPSQQVYIYRLDSEPAIQDFEKSPLRFEMEALLEEYKTLWAEIHLRLTNQQQIINYAIALIAAGIAVSQILPGMADFASIVRGTRPLYILISLIFSSFALMYLEHDAMVAYLAIYIDRHLRPRMERILYETSGSNKRIWEWNEFRGRSQFQSYRSVPFSAVMSASRYAITIIPAILLLIYYWSNRRTAESVSTWENLAFGFAVSIIILVFLTLAYAMRLYLSYPEPIVKPEPSIFKAVSRFVWRQRYFILLIALIIAYFALGVAIAVRNRYATRAAQVDFNTYYAAATLFTSGQNMYDGKLAAEIVRSYQLEYIDGSDYIYPPYLAGLLSAVVYLNPLSLGFVWYSVSLAALLIAVWMIVRCGKDLNNISEFWPKWSTALILIFLFVPTAYSFYVGQVNSILLLLLAGTYFCLKSNKQVLAGMLLGLSILIKVAPVLLVVYLVTRKKYVALIFTVAVISLIVLTTLPIFASNLRTYTTVVFSMLSTPVPHPVNQSLNGFFSRLFVLNDYSVPIHNMPILARILTLLSSLIILLFVLRKSSCVTNSTEDLYFGALICLMVISSPLAWENLYILLVL